ncbi:MAG TPA: penicillin-insensitive murein endopeptidase [Polyangiaceae bacterium]|nr:penicillin-insensitive murein endopeptidase [Polyangiaceae bacterium]
MVAAIGCASSQDHVTRAPVALPPAATPPALAVVAERPRTEVADQPSEMVTEDPPAREIEDEVEPHAAPPDVQGRPVEHPLLRLSDQELQKRFESDPSGIGSMSLGRASGGGLVNGVQMSEGELWTLITPAVAWGTEETINYLKRAIEKVHQSHPGGHKLQIGHLSSRRGGRLHPHKSHQSGRDVDISYFYRSGSQQLWFKRANIETLDVVRSWAFVRALVTETDVEYIFINGSVQKLLKEHALSIGEDPEWLDSIFEYQSRGRWPIVRHAPGHDTHIHVRFYSPLAQELGRRLHKSLSGKGLVAPVSLYVSHRARKGDLLGNLAKRYGTTVEAIMRANGLRNTKIRAGRTYQIPKKGAAAVVSPSQPTLIPPRRLPPARTASARKKSASPATP